VSLHSPAPQRAQAIRYILRSRLLRGAFVSLVISGIGISVTAPQMTLFLVGELRLSTTAAGLYYVTNLATPIAGYVLGTLSDRAGSRLLVFRLSALAGCAGWVLMAFATQPWAPFAINIALLSAAGAGAAQLQAAARDELDRHPTPADNQVVAITRMAMAIGWIVGPVIGAVLGAVLGLRPLLFVTGVSLLVSLVPLIGAGPARPRRRSVAPPADILPARQRRPRSDGPRSDRTGPMAPLLLFTGIYVLIMCGETVKLAYLPLYMDRELHVDAAVRGAIIGFQPLVEVMLMPLAAVLADRFGIARVLYTGAATAVAAHLCYAAAGDLPAHLALLVAGQFLMAGVIATFGVLGVTVAQRFQPSRVGMASSVFLSAFAINGAVGGLIGSIGTSWLGLPHLFWISASLAALGTIALFALNALVPLDGRIRRSPSDTAPVSRPAIND